MMIVFPKENAAPGDYVDVYVDDCTAITLLGNITAHYPRVNSEVQVNH
jgi:hypothetical protein